MKWPSFEPVRFGILLAEGRFSATVSWKAAPGSYMYLTFAAADDSCTDCQGWDRSVAVLFR
jgi:hypothetical protein